MDDLNAMLSSVLSDPDKVRQIQEMAANLGFGAAEEPAPPPPPPPPPSPPPTQTPDLSALAAMLNAALGQGQPAPPVSNTPDLSALIGMLGGNSANQSQSGTPDLSALAGMLGNSGGQAQNSTPDLSTLAGMLGNAMGGQPQKAEPTSGAGFDVAALTNMLGGPPQGGGGNAPGLPIDMSTIMKLGQAMSSMQGNRQNIDFLLSLKPRCNERRAKKIDDAIKVMQLIQFLPLIKETGLFGGLDDLLGGLGGSGGLGNLLGNMGIGSGGRGGLLGGLLGL